MALILNTHIGEAKITIGTGVSLAGVVCSNCGANIQVNNATEPGKTDGCECLMSMTWDSEKKEYAFLCYCCSVDRYENGSGEYQEGKVAEERNKKEYYVIRTDSGYLECDPVDYVINGQSWNPKKATKFVDITDAACTLDDIKENYRGYPGISNSLNNARVEKIRI